MSNYHVQQETIFVSQQRGIEHPASYTQERFSEMIGIGTKSLSAIERGTVGVSLTLLVKICNTLCVSSNVLLFESTPRNDVQSITERLERLNPQQFDIANSVICKLFEAFTLNNE